MFCFRFRMICAKVSGIGRYRFTRAAMAHDAFRLLYLSPPDKPAYLKPVHTSKDLTEGDTNAAGGEQHSGSALAPYSTLFTFHIPETKQISDPKDKAHCYVRSCLSCQRVYRHICEIPELSRYVEFVLGAKMENGWLSRRLFAFIADDTSTDPSKTFETAKRRAKEEDDNVVVCMYKKDPKVSSQAVRWKLQASETEEAQKMSPEVLEEDVKGGVMPSPIFSEEKFSPVFHDQQRAMEVLDMYSECPEVSRLKEIARKELGEQKSVTELSAMMQHPLVVVEGMDATGKTTLTQFLKEKLQAARYSTPPPCLLELRRFFDKLPEIVRRSYYSVGNYIVAQQIARECQNRAVVMDRYWHSTAAYGIANETSMSDLPPEGHSVYRWPSDLLPPTAVVFLTVTEDVRRERLGHRHDSEITFEERNLNKDRIFRQRLCKAYLRMREPACVEVDASGTEDEVVNLVLKELQRQGVRLASSWTQVEQG